MQEMKPWTIRAVHLGSVVIFLKRKLETPTNTDDVSGRALPLRLQFQAELVKSAKALWNTASVEYQRSLP